MVIDSTAAGFIFVSKRLANRKDYRNMRTGATVYADECWRGQGAFGS
jgi:hypothetical protein